MTGLRQAGDGMWLLLARGISIALGILGLPILMSSLGHLQFGAWAVLLGGVFAFGTLEFGLSSAVVRWASLAQSRTNSMGAPASPSLDAVLSNALLCTFIVYCLGGVLLLSVVEPIAAWLQLPETPLLSPANCILWVYSTVAAVALLRCANSLMQSSGRMRAFAVTSVAQSLTGAVLTWPVAFLTERLDLLLFANTFALLLVQSLAAVWTRRRVHWKMRRRHIELKLMAAMFRHGSALQLSDLATFVMFQFDKLIIAGVVTPSEVSHYEVASRSAQALGQLPQAPFAALTPVWTRQHARDESLAAPAVQMLRITIIGIGFFLLLPLAVAPIGLFAWVGQVGYHAAAVFMLLTVALIANLLVLPLSICAQAIGRASLELRRALIAMICNAPLTLTLIQVYGKEGAALGTAIACVLANAWFATQLMRALHLSIRQFLSALWPVVLPVIVVFSVLAISAQAIEPIVIVSRWRMAPASAMLYAAAATTLVFWLLRGRVLTADEQAFLIRLPKVGPLIQRLLPMSGVTSPEGSK
ncbi:MAG: oligosaccharide flippase family protein [Pseudomarimonas sp.]